jgi:hypothetical protein
MQIEFGPLDLESSTMRGQRLPGVVRARPDPANGGGDDSADLAEAMGWPGLDGNLMASHDPY